jgi:hypothetical protein
VRVGRVSQFTGANLVHALPLLVRRSSAPVEPQCVYLMSSSRSEPPETSIARTAWPLPLA